MVTHAILKLALLSWQFPSLVKWICWMVLLFCLKMIFWFPVLTVNDQWILIKLLLYSDFFKFRMFKFCGQFYSVFYAIYWGYNNKWTMLRKKVGGSNPTFVIRDWMIKDRYLINIYWVSSDLKSKKWHWHGFKRGSKKSKKLTKYAILQQFLNEV